VAATLGAGARRSWWTEHVRWLALLCLIGGLLAGCGLGVQSPDLFLLTRTGVGAPLTMLVNDGGTIRCNGGKTRQLADPLLIQARDLASNLDKDAKASLSIPPGPRSVARYRIRLQNGTINFPDTAAAVHHELAQAELFTVQAAQKACGLSG
jgi:hypothetical protein